MTRALTGPLVFVLAVTSAVMLLPVVPAAQPGVRTVTATIDDVAGLRNWETTLVGLERDDALGIRRELADELLPDTLHTRLDQYHDGVRVLGGQIVRQTVRGQTRSIFGRLHEGIALDATPGITADTARGVVERDAGVTLGPTREPELVVLPRNGGYALAYTVRAFGRDGLTRYFVDARSGAILVRRSDLKTQASVGGGTGVLGDRKKISVRGSGSVFRADDELRPPSLQTFDLDGDLNRTIDFLNEAISLGEADLASDEDNQWTDGANVDGHTYAAWVYDYYFRRFGRQGLDDRDLPLRNIVHPVRRADIFGYPSDIIGTFYLNAFYAGDGVMVYGEGLPPNLVDTAGRQWNFLAGALDVVAHELTHGVTDFTSDLIYENESGALNEAFSDIMAAGVEFFYQTAGDGQMEADYLIAEDVVTPGGIRSMADPAVFGDPDHYSIRFTGPEDNGGVHINSGIVNQAFYLAIEGGTNRTSGHTVTGVGGDNRAQVETVFYRAFTTLLPSGATFSVARAATLQSARDLHGAGSDVERALAAAWTAVGVE